MTEKKQTPSKKKEKKETNEVVENTAENNKEESEEGKQMIVVIRIKGCVGVKRKMAEGLKRFGLNTKYSCIILRGTKVDKGMLKNLRDYVAYGKIGKEEFKGLLEARAKVINGNEKKPSAEEIVKGFEQGKKLKEMNTQPVFKLHPPRKGIESKQRYPRGVLGNHGEKINELLKRML